MGLTFFHVFYQEKSSEILAIPELDSLEVLESLFHGVSLRDQYGNKWPVKLENIGNLLHFKIGWSKFVKDNSVEDGDFLFFRYDGDKVIDVKLTGKNACDKKGVGALKFIEMEEEHAKAKPVYVEMEEVGSNEVEGSEYEPFGEQVDEDEQEGSDEEIEEQEDQSYEELVDEEEQEETSDEEEQKETSDEEVKAWAAKRHKIKVKRELSKLKNRINNLAKKVGGRKSNDVIELGESSTIRSEAATPKPGCAKRGRRKNPDYYGKEIFKSRILPKPQNPYFVTVIRPRRRDELYIPREVIKDIGLKKLPKKATLRDSSGGTWITRLTRWDDGSKFFVGGWKSFCMVNGVGEKDLCVCEFIKGNNTKKDLTIQIQVVPANNNVNFVKDQQKRRKMHG